MCSVASFVQTDPNELLFESVAKPTSWTNLLKLHKDTPLMLPRRLLYDCLRVRTSACHLPFDRCAGCPWCLKNCRPHAWFASSSVVERIPHVDRTISQNGQTCLASCYAIRDGLRIQQVRRSSEFCCMTICIICVRTYIFSTCSFTRSCAFGSR